MYFSENLFGINAHNDLSSELLLEFTSCVLSIVLSHHYQKRDIKSMVNGTQVDFQLVRETMYKYSKKAEDRFFKNPCMAFLFIKFAQSPLAKTQIMNKQPKNQQNEEDDDQIDLNMKQHEVNERILAEMQHMKQEASKILFKQFLANVEQICLNNISILTKSQSMQKYFETVKMDCFNSDMTVHLMEFLDVTAIDALIKKQISKVFERSESGREMPLLNSIAADIQFYQSEMQKTHSVQVTKPQVIMDLPLQPMTEPTYTTVESEQETPMKPRPSD